MTDGLRAEREQGITIDVAYRYFATPKRKFIIADTPGHIQYTRNMVTGTSTAQLAIVLVDARHGLLEQSRRHAFLASLLGIRHIVLAVNKMDLDRLGPRAIREDPRRLPRVRGPARRPRRDDDPAVGAARRQRGHEVGQHPVVRRSGAAVPSRRGLHRRRPQPGRRAVPRPVRDPAADPRPRRPPQLRGHRRQRRDAARRRDRRAAHRKDQPHHRDRGPERACRGGVPADGGVGQPRRRHRHLARRHDRAAEQSAARGAGVRRHGVLDGRRERRWSRAATTSSSTPPARRGSR